MTHQPHSDQTRYKTTCLSVDCPERTGGKCIHETSEPTQPGSVSSRHETLRSILEGLIPEPYKSKAILSRDHTRTGWNAAIIETRTNLDQAEAALNAYVEERVREELKALDGKSYWANVTTDDMRARACIINAHHIIDRLAELEKGKS